MISLKTILTEDFLSEGSFLPSDIPTHFYCAVKFDVTSRSSMEQFAVRRLEGIQGITEEFAIANGFFSYGGRNALITMDGHQTIKENSLSRVNYHKPDYLASKNLSASQRIQGIGFTDANIFRTAIEELVKPLYEDENYTEIAPILESDYEMLFSVLMASKSKINNVGQFALRFLDVWQGMRPKTPIKKMFPVEAVKTALSAALAMEVGAYSHEKEWLLKNKILVIPLKSEIKLFSENPRQKIDQQAAIEKYELDKLYQFSL